MASAAQPELAELLALVRPMLHVAATLEPAQQRDPNQAAAVEQALAARFPLDGAEARAVGQCIRRGVREGWLCNRGEPASRFSRVAKPGPESAGFSVDVVSMIGDAVDHTHPNGEITLGFAADASDNEICRFEGRPPGWVFLAPGSRHIPRVDGARMVLIYFLPDGAVQWHPAV